MWNVHLNTIKILTMLWQQLKHVCYINAATICLKTCIGSGSSISISSSSSGSGSSSGGSSSNSSMENKNTVVY